jgi:hypothetical protein
MEVVKRQQTIGRALFEPLWKEEIAFCLGKMRFCYTVGTDTHRLYVAIDILEPTDKLWPIVPDLASIKSYSPHLSIITLLSAMLTHHSPVFPVNW